MCTARPAYRGHALYTISWKDFQLATARLASGTSATLHFVAYDRTLSIIITALLGLTPCIAVPIHYAYELFRAVQVQCSCE